MRWVLAIVLVAAACGGCDGGGETADAPRADAMIDADTACAGTQLFTGELIDFDSTTASFAGVFGAVFSLRGDAGCTATTAPNGRFQLMVPSGVDIVADVDAPGDYVDAIVVAETEAITDVAVISYRLLTRTRARAFYMAQVGVPFDDPGQHILVFDYPDRVGLTIDRSHDAPQAASDDDGDGVYTWTSGSTGRYVLFPNVELQPDATISGDPTGGLYIPIEADRFTLVAEHIVIPI